MRENTDQKISEYRHFLPSDIEIKPNSLVPVGQTGLQRFSKLQFDLFTLKNLQGGQNY